MIRCARKPRPVSVYRRAFDRVATQTPPQKFLQRNLTLDERQCAQILPIEVQQVKRDEHALTLAEKEITEHWPAGVINTCYLAIENCAFNGKMLVSSEHIQQFSSMYELPVVSEGAELVFFDGTARAV
jgi:hypothetical protein